MQMDPIGPNPGGICMCGCGEKTRIASRTQTAEGWLKGHPIRFVRGHQRHVKDRWEERDCGHDTPCWVWLLRLDDRGYGHTYRGRAGKSNLAHVAMWEDHHGPVPEGLELDHLCRVRACVNPAHLEPVTHTENIRRGAVTKLDAAKVRAIRSSRETRAVLAERYGVTVHTIKAIRRRVIWKDV